MLLIESDDDEVAALRAALNGDPLAHATFALECADRISTGLARLHDGGIDVLLLELSLPDGDGLETLARLREHGPDLPIVVLTSVDNEALGLQAVRSGAQDYLVKGRATPDAVVRALRYARERHKLQAALQSLALVDPLTGLHNRRGFQLLAEQALRVAERTGRGLVLVLADMDALKQINDSFGHQAGDRMIAEAAAAFRATMRRSDILARIGGDEFAVAALDAPAPTAELIVGRLEAHLQEVNARGQLAGRLSLSLGAVPYEPTRHRSLDELMAEADRALYRRKPGVGR